VTENKNAIIQLKREQAVEAKMQGNQATMESQIDWATGEVKRGYKRKGFTQFSQE